MEGFLWFAQTSGALDLLRLFARPLAIMFVLYYSSYVPIFISVILTRFKLVKDPIDKERPPLPDAILVLPTLLANRSALEGLQSAMRSIIANRYPSRLTICPAIDDANQMRPLVHELQNWVSGLSLPPTIDIQIALCPKRVGKSMAIDAAIDLVKAQVERGERSEFPPVFFNVDADSELSPRALERMAFRLTTPRGLFSECPKIVTSNVQVRRSHYWKGWRHFFTIEGQLTLSAAREYTNSIGLGRHPGRVMPVTTVSGALYCVWSEVHLQAPSYGRFIQSLNVRDWLRWWMGALPPRFAEGGYEPLPEAAIGPGDDTWITWIAMSSRWKNGRLDLELPATPFHALLELFQGWLSRPIGYDPAAAVLTSSPRTMRALFKQRIRWNTSRQWLVQRRGVSFLYTWAVALPVLVELALLFAVHAAIVLTFVLFPMVTLPTTWLSLFIVLQIFYILLRTGATLLAMAQDGDFLERWPLLLALPLSGLFHVVFNIVPTIVGFAQDLLFSGVNTKFAPEETLIKEGTSRVALGYRIKRAYTLAVRATWNGDVTPGWFWFGWGETPWTTNGYTGWTTPPQPTQQETQPIALAEFNIADLPPRRRLAHDKTQAIKPLKPVVSGHRSSSHGSSEGKAATFNRSEVGLADQPSVGSPNATRRTG